MKKLANGGHASLLNADYLQQRQQDDSESSENSSISLSAGSQLNEILSQERMTDADAYSQDDRFDDDDDNNEAFFQRIYSSFINFLLTMKESLPTKKEMIFYSKHTLKEANRRKCNCCLGACSCLIVVVISALCYTLVDNAPIVFLKEAEVEQSNLFLFCRIFPFLAVIVVSNRVTWDSVLFFFIFTKCLIFFFWHVWQSSTQANKRKQQQQNKQFSESKHHIQKGNLPVWTKFYLIRSRCTGCDCSITSRLVHPSFVLFFFGMHGLSFLLLFIVFFLLCFVLDFTFLFFFAIFLFFAQNEGCLWTIRCSNNNR